MARTDQIPAQFLQNETAAIAMSLPNGKLMVPYFQQN